MLECRISHGAGLDQLTGRTFDRGFQVSADTKYQRRAHTVSYIPLKQNCRRKEGGVDLFMHQQDILEDITFLCFLLSPIPV